MPKVTIPPIGNPENSSFVTKLNEAVDKLADEFEKVVYRDGSFDVDGPIDMGSQRLYNLPAPVTANEPLRAGDVIDEAAMATAAGSILMAKFLRLGVDPSDPPFNATGNGSTADNTAVLAALTYAFANGLPVDGGDKVFAVSSSLIFNALTNPHIKRLRLKQLTPAADKSTLAFTSCQKILVESLEVNLGTSPTVGNFQSSFGFHVSGGSDHRISNVTVFGDGKNSLIYMLGVSDSVFTNFTARDATFDDVAAADDVMHGIWINNCVDCQLVTPKVHDLTGNAQYLNSSAVLTTYANLRTRGIILSGCEGVTVLDPEVRNVDQGIDLTGSSGNRKCTIIGGRTYNCGSVGVKLANSAVYCKVIGHTAENIGMYCFMASGPAEAGLPFKTQDCDFIGCTAINPGYNNIQFAEKAGFIIRAGDFDGDFPKGIRFIACNAFDNQAVKTMKWGLYNEGILYDNVAKRPNVAIDCKSNGHTSFAEGNFHRPKCRVSGTTLLATTTGAALLAVGWDNESSPFEDSMNMHSTSSNTERVTVPVTGLYRIRSKIVWQSSNTTGYRRTALLKNGSPIATTTDAPVASENTVNMLDETYDLVAGDYLNISVDQNSGLTVQVSRPASYFEVELVREF